jgi:hypothetical protein
MPAESNAGRRLKHGPTALIDEPQLGSRSISLALLGRVDQVIA